MQCEILQIITRKLFELACDKSFVQGMVGWRCLADEMECHKVFEERSLQEGLVAIIEGAPSIGFAYDGQRKLFVIGWEQYRERVQRGETSDADDHSR